MSSTFTHKGVHLVRADEQLREIASLQARYGDPVGVGGVLEDLDRTATEAWVPGRAPAWGFRWNSQDGASRSWWPQGISSSADASGSDDVDGRRLIVTSWYSQGAGQANQGSRLTFVDLDRLRYRHVLLVRAGKDPLGGTTFRPLKIHAGGVVWCGPYLHLAGTERGIFTCDVGDIMRVSRDSDTFGYRYVLPVRWVYDAVAEGATPKLRYSNLSLDRGADPAELVAGEYATAGRTTRLIRYQLDPETQHLRRDDAGRSVPVFLDDGGVEHMQGAAVVDGTYYVTVSRGARRRGHLYVGSPGSLRAHRWALPPGPEDISYWPSRDQLWSLSEHPGRRYVFAIDRSALRGSRSVASYLRLLRTS